MNIVVGDMLNPKEKGQKIIAHVVNDQGEWPDSLTTKKMNKRWSTVRRHYLDRFLNDSEGLKLGTVQFVVVAMDKIVANMVAQHGMTRGGEVYADKGMLEDCLDVVRFKARQLGASVILSPASVTGGEFGDVSGLIDDVFGEDGVSVYVDSERMKAELEEELKPEELPVKPEEEKEPKKEDTKEEKEPETGVVDEKPTEPEKKEDTEIVEPKKETVEGKPVENESVEKVVVGKKPENVEKEVKDVKPEDVAQKAGEESAKIEETTTAQPKSGGDGEVAGAGREQVESADKIDNVEEKADTVEEHKAEDVEDKTE